MKKPRRWMFWLPALYLLAMAFVFIDVKFSLSGYGEANLGAWVYVGFMLPWLYAGKALGFVPSVRLEDFAKVIALQVIGWAAIGAMLDLVGRYLRTRSDR